MDKTISSRVRAVSYLLMLIYFGSYVMRINFAVMMVKIGAEMELEKSALAVIVTGLTVFYGLGQIVSGIIGDKIKPRYMLSIGLFLAAASNVAICLCDTVPLMTVVWCVNGFAHSMLWPPIVRTMSTYFDDAEYSYAAVRVSWGSSVATILLYSLCPLLLTVMNWRYIMLLCAACGVAIATVWLIFEKKLISTMNEREVMLPTNDKGASAYKMPKYVIIPIVLVMLGIIFQGMLRDGVTNWMPSYLLESFGMSEESSIFATVILAVFSIISFYIFDLLHRKVFKNEVFCAGVIYIASFISAAVLYVINRFADSAIASMLLMAVIVACMHGINLMLISVVPKRFAASGKVSTFSGIFNSCTYIGAAISTYGFAAIAEGEGGWNATILLWAIIALLGCIMCFVAIPLWKKFCAHSGNGQ